MHTFLTCKNTDVLVKSLFSHTGLLAGKYLQPDHLSLLVLINNAGDIRQDRQLGMHLIDWRSSGSESTLTYIYQLINSLKETRDIFGILASVLRLIEEGISHDLISNTTKLGRVLCCILFYFSFHLLYSI